MQKYYSGSANKFEFDVSGSSYKGNCQMWSLGFNDGKFNNTSIINSIVTLPDDIWGFRNTTVDFIIEFDTKFPSNIPQESLDYIRERVINNIEGCSTDWKVTESNGVIAITHHLQDVIGRDDDEIAEMILEFYIGHTTRIADNYYKLAVNTFK